MHVICILRLHVTPVKSMTVIVNTADARKEETGMRAKKSLSTDSTGSTHAWGMFTLSEESD